ncbi:hypothetical protein [Pseudomonas sp. UM16]|uniref:hypothetical protein n=1 Tax=Pseudomonas sp. UM16 TaxID=3158962 RepID=UPI0039901659
MSIHTPRTLIGGVALLAEAQLTEAMVDLLIETVHKIGTRSKRKVVGDIAKDIERVYGEERLLVEIASASIDEPAGCVCDIIFPIVGADFADAQPAGYRNISKTLKPSNWEEASRA